MVSIIWKRRKYHLDCLEVARGTQSASAQLLVDFYTTILMNYSCFGFRETRWYFRGCFVANPDNTTRSIRALVPVQRLTLINACIVFKCLGKIICLCLAHWQIEVKIEVTLRLGTSRLSNTVMSLKAVIKA